LLLEITDRAASKLDLRRLVEALSTNLLGVTRRDFCARYRRMPIAESCA
jgi:formate hydrogenlyase transcriptional activator